MDNDDDSGRNGRSSRSKHDRSPEHRHNGRGRHRSQSPQRHSMPRDEVSGDIQPYFKLLFHSFCIVTLFFFFFLVKNGEFHAFVFMLLMELKVEFLVLLEVD